MNREIKFRDYDMDNKVLRHFNLDTYNTYEHDSWGNIMQFTNVLDNNNQDVYEGDIVGSVMDCCNGNNCEIVFHDGCFCAKYKDNYRPLTKTHLGNWMEINDVSFGYDFTIKGNIHQNPELI